MTALLLVTAVTAQAVQYALYGAPAQSSAPERTWLGWSSGFAPAFVVIGAAYVLVRLIRRRRDNSTKD